jgi:hypothetical protein
LLAWCRRHVDQPTSTVSGQSTPRRPRARPCTRLQAGFDIGVYNIEGSAWNGNFGVWGRRQHQYVGLDEQSHRWRPTSSPPPAVGVGAVRQASRSCRESFSAKSMCATTHFSGTCVVQQRRRRFPGSPTRR